MPSSPPQILSHWPAWPPPLSAPMITSDEHPCLYLPGKMTRTRALLAARLPPSLYHEFMGAGFRRSGKVIYQPVCRGCRACVPLRVIVEQFRLSKSQRRCWRRNADLVVDIGKPDATDEKHALYVRYMRDWHGSQTDDYESFVSFLYESPVRTIEFAYRTRAGLLVAVGICDVCSLSLSSVYFYYDPGQTRRSLGTYGALYEISYAQSRQIPYYYLGYSVQGCRSMQYKAAFQPSQVLDTDGQWRYKRLDRVPVDGR